MKKIKIVNLIFFISVIIINYLAVIFPIGGLTTGEISDLFPILLTPSGLTFSIWGIIYITLFIVILRNLLSKNELMDSEVNILGIYFIVNCAGNILWMLCWQFRLFTFSFLMMLVILFTLIKINLTEGEKSWIFKSSFSIYFGWISVAILLNACIVLYQFNIEVGYTGTVILMFIAAIAALFFCIVKKLPFYAITVAWALFGNYLKHDFIIPLILSMILIIVVIIVQFISKKGCPLKKQ